MTVLSLFLMPKNIKINAPHIIIEMIIILEVIIDQILELITKNNLVLSLKIIKKKNILNVLYILSFKYYYCYYYH